MNPRTVVILVVLLAVLGGGALIYSRQQGERPANVAALGRPLLKDLQAAEISTIRITEPKAALTLERKEDGWTIAERGGFPADLGKVRELVLKAIELKVGQSEPIGEKDRARLNLDASGTTLEFLGAGGKALGKLIVGKKYFKREVENAARAPGDGRFVMLPEDPKNVLVVSDPLQLATTRTSEWIDRTAFQVERVKSLEVRYPDGSGWRIERNADDAGWRLAGATAGEKLDVSRANAASYSLSMVELADVAPKDAQDTGLDKPTLVNATTLDGLSYAIKVGRLEGDNYYVTFSSSGTLAKDEKDAERTKKLEARLPREKIVSEHVLLIPKSKLDDTLKRRAELLEKKEDSKK